MIPIRKPDNGIYNTIPLASGLSIVQSTTPIRSTTPIPNAVDSSKCDDAWNPNSATPRVQRPVHWLDQDKIQSTRLKLYVSQKPNDVLEFKGVFGDNAQVRDRRETKMVPLDDLYPVRPTANGDLVTTIAGPMAGVALKVREYRPEGCVVRQPGKVLKKHETDPIIPTAELVQIFPYIR